MSPPDVGESVSEKLLFFRRRIWGWRAWIAVWEKKAFGRAGCCEDERGGREMGYEEGGKEDIKEGLGGLRL